MSTPENNQIVDIPNNYPVGMSIDEVTKWISTISNWLDTQYLDQSQQNLYNRKIMEGQNQILNLLNISNSQILSEILHSNEKSSKVTKKLSIITIVFAVLTTLITAISVYQVWITSYKSDAFNQNIIKELQIISQK